jgi:plastocyanin
MIMTRRRLIRAGGGFLAAFFAGPAPAATGAVVEITMQGRGGGAHVWFDPVGIHIEPGSTVRWINRDPGNSHTVTSYHPKIFERPLRIPAAATPWNSDYLLPEESFAMTFASVGVYDYHCVPHEHAGMVGRIVVGMPAAAEAASDTPAAGLTPLPEAALKGFPPMAEIIAKGSVRRS